MGARIKKPSSKRHTQVVTAPQTPHLPLGEIMDDEERQRMAASYREYMLTEEERLAIIEKYGPPKMPLGSYSSITMHTRRRAV